MNDLDLELYRALKSQSASYNDKLQSLWLQKLTLSGTVAAFIILSSGDIAKLQPFSPILIGVGLALLLAITIDFKVLEYGLYVRSISCFIMREFADASKPAAWEALLWGERNTPERSLALWRSTLTVASAAVPTLALIGVMTWLLGNARMIMLPWLLGGLAALAYLLVLGISAWSVLRSSDD